MSLCACFKEVDEQLRKQGLKLSDRLFNFNLVPGCGLDLNFHLPLERTDGKRIQRKDPKTMRPSHCPFCGKPVQLRKPKAESEKEAQ